MADQKKTEIIYRPTTTDHKNIKFSTKVESKRDINFSLYFAVFCANLQAFAGGNAYGWSSTVLIDLQSNDTQINPLGKPITSLEESWIVSLVNLGAAVATILSGYCSNRFGKKRTLLLFGLPVILSHVILILGNTVKLFLVARFLMGLGIGCTNSVVPLYVAEISETHIRGFLGCFLGILFSLGILSVYVLGAFLNIKMLSAVLLIPLGFFYLFFGYYCPESPYYYLINGDISSAKKSLNKLRKTESEFIDQELADIEEVLQESKINQPIGEALKTRKFIRAIIITVTLMFFQQFVGSTVLMSYMETILSVADGLISSSVSSIIISVITVLSVFASTFLIDKWGRKILLVIACLGCSISLIAIGIYFFMKTSAMDVKSLSWLPFLSLVVYMISFSFGLGPIPWALNGELFSNKTKELASSFTTFISLILAFITTLIFPILKASIGLHGSFWFFAGNAIICLVFVLWFVPETKGKTFQEILNMLER